MGWWVIRAVSTWLPGAILELDLGEEEPEIHCGGLDMDDR